MCQCQLDLMTKLRSKCVHLANDGPRVVASCTPIGQYRMQVRFLAENHIFPAPQRGEAIFS